MRKGQALRVALAFCLGSSAAAAGPKSKPGDAKPSVEAKSQSAKTTEAAQKVYLQGTTHYKAGRLLEALAAFRASYDMVASPNSHIMIARTLRDKGDIAQAFVEYDRVVAEAEEAIQRDTKYQATADAARAERTKLREKVTMVIVRVRNPPDDLHVVVADKPIERVDWGKPVPVAAGAVVALGVSAGRPDQRKELSAIAGEELVVLFDYETPAPAPAPVEPAPPPKVADEDLKATRFAANDSVPDIPRQPPRVPPPPVDRTWTYVALGAGGAGMVTFITFGALNQKTYGDLQDACPNMHCTSNRQDDIDKGQRYQTIANIGLGVGLVGAAVGVFLFATSDDTSAPPAIDAARRPKGIVLTDVAVSPGSLQVRGAF